MDPPRLQNILMLDPYLHDYKEELKSRFNRVCHMLEAIENDEVPNSPKGNYLRFFEDSSTSKSIDKSMVPYPIQPGFNAFTRSYLEYGIHRLPDNSIRCVEWAPAARALYLKGDFNQWKSREFQFESKPFGKWVLSIPPAADGSPRIRHGHILKLEVETPSGELVERLCPWARYVKRSKSSTQFEHVFWDPPASERYEWRSPLPPLETPDRLRIYEAHVGIASDEEKVSTYTHFREKVLPRIKKLGYNAVELMAIMEHAYYGSFGYQVTSFFAPSSRYGTPDELRALVDAAHALGLRVLLDVVHSHASKNVLDGLNQFDGTDACFFRSGPSGSHPIWDSRMFDYGSREVLRFLLSNLRYWADEFRFDGYRFDGVTAMMYWSRGVDHPFSGDYHEYFGMHVDTDALRFLALANYMLHSRALQRPVLTISEDVSGMPTLSRPIEEGGGGFDYRMQMAAPDLWQKLFKEAVSDEDWPMQVIWWQLVNRRAQQGEPCIAYAECHDQALVGDKSIAFWLMDKAMYTHMTRLLMPQFGVNAGDREHLIIDRGIALHKMIRAVTHALAGEAYLNFIGNEFGHPEWLDFPRAGNNESYYYARRQFRLLEDTSLRYIDLNSFDEALNGLERALGPFGWLAAPSAYVSRKHDGDKVLVFERGGFWRSGYPQDPKNPSPESAAEQAAAARGIGRGENGGLVWAFNFHPSQSFPDYRIGVRIPGEYRMVLNSDDTRFGGHGRLDATVRYASQQYGHDGRGHSILLYLPCRTCVVLAHADIAQRLVHSQ